MSIFDRIASLGHEQVIFCQEPASQYRAILCIHSTRLGPAIGGTRVLRYASEEDALVDALRLSRAMTYKNAAAGLGVGGGKAVILAPEGDFDREKLFRAHGRAIDRLGGRFTTGEDVGTSPADMEFVALETKWVGGRTGRAGGDPSPWTALGVFCGMQAAAHAQWGSRDLRGRSVAIQGLGNVGMALGQHLHEAGARLIVADVNVDRVRRAREAWDATSVEPDAVLAAEADILAPCALGGVLNDESVPRIRAQVVAGAANNQLLDDCHGAMLAGRGIVYAPDYIINAGGVLTAGVGLHGWSLAEVETKVRGIFDTVGEVLALARRDGLPTNQAADRFAEIRLQPSGS
ncbi:MAG: Glu/Leu/Phe/Val dehydrogenase dimerization domain-containing protein [Bryobacteraceae bacterium]